MKKTVIATIAVFFTYTILDFIIHNVLLAESYGATAELWRPVEEMKMGIMSLVTFVAALTLVLVYAKLVQPKSLAAGCTLGLLFGIGAGISMGFGTYSVMPLPVNLAWAWMLGTIVEGVAAGAVVASIVKA